MANSSKTVHEATVSRVHNSILQLDSRVRSAEAWIVDAAPTKSQCRELIQRYNEAIEQKLVLLAARCRLPFTAR